MIKKTAKKSREKAEGRVKFANKGKKKLNRGGVQGEPHEKVEKRTAKKRRSAEGHL